MTAPDSASDNDSSRIQAGIHAMLHPRNVVIVGATDKPRNYAERIWHNIKRYEYAGRIFPLNGSRDEIWGTKCYRSFQDLPEAPDHVVILVPARFVAQVLRDAAAAGARSATIVSSGFSESEEPEAQQLARELQHTVRETGLAVSGPNCLGNLSAPARLFTNLDERPVSMIAGPVAIVGQSGAIVMHIRSALESRGLDVSYMVTSGNEAGLGTSDFMAYFAANPHVRVIVVYLEGIRDPAAFRAACQAAKAQGKAIILLKLGASEGGRAAAMAHTGALAGSIECFDAVATRDGVVRVGNFDELVETTECFVHVRPRGNRLAAVTPSGGKRGLLIDAFSSAGMDFGPLGDETTAKLRQLLGTGSIIGNPLDAGFTANVSPAANVESIRLMIEDPNIDLVVVDSEWPQAPHELRERNIRQVDALAAKAGKPVVYLNFFSVGFTAHARELRKQVPHLAVMLGIDRTVKALRARMQHAVLPARPRCTASTPTTQQRQVLDRLLGDAGAAALSEAASKELFQAYGIPVSAEGTARTAADAVAIAERIGYPVVAKVVSSEILHKSDIGGVVLDLHSAAAVERAFVDITKRVKALPGSPRMDGVLVAQQVRGELELVIGATWDAEVGPVVLFGTGGIDVELTKDIALAAAPLDEDEARQLIGRTRAGIKLRGYRGRPALDEASVVQALVGMARLIRDADGRIASIDMNPFLVSQAAGVAVDGLVVLNPQRQGSTAC